MVSLASKKHNTKTHTMEEGVFHSECLYFWFWPTGRSI